MENAKVIAALGALAQESRLATFRLLVKRGSQGFTPSELAERLCIAAPTLSFHLKELQHAGLVLVRREGRFLYYAANYPEMQGLIDYLTENCCTLADESCCEPPKPAAKKRKASKRRAA